jgi:uncharacterized protein (TIGR02996 family)
MIGGIAILFVVVRCIANLPLSLTGIEAMKLALFGLLVVIGLVLGSIRSLVGFSGDERPAPLVLLAILVGLGGFLLHSMVDFALFEPGPLMVMMLLLGSVLGVRHPSVAGRKPRTWIAIAALAIVALALVAHSLLIVGPIVVAESKASEAADLANHGRVAKAVELYRAADTSSPVDNYYYAQRAAELLQTTPGFDPKEVLALHTRAASANPDSAGPWLNLARFLRALRDPELSTPSIIDSDYQRVLTRNPNDAPLRLEYADYLLETNRRDAAVEQIKKALDYNDKLDAKEPRRLRKEREEEAKRVIAGGAPQKP